MPGDREPQAGFGHRAGAPIAGHRQGGSADEGAREPWQAFARVVHSRHLQTKRVGVVELHRDLI